MVLTEETTNFELLYRGVHDRTHNTNYIGVQDNSSNSLRINFLDDLCRTLMNRINASNIEGKTIYYMPVSGEFNYLLIFDDKSFQEITNQYGRMYHTTKFAKNDKNRINLQKSVLAQIGIDGGSHVVYVGYENHIRMYEASAFEQMRQKQFEGLH